MSKYSPLSFSQKCRLTDSSSHPQFYSLSLSSTERNFPAIAYFSLHAQMEEGGGGETVSMIVYYICSDKMQ